MNPRTANAPPPRDDVAGPHEARSVRELRAILAGYPDTVELWDSLILEYAPADRYTRARLYVQMVYQQDDLK